LDTRRGSAIARPDQSRKIVGVYFREPQATFEIHSNPPKAAEGEGEMTGLRPAGRPWTLTDDDMLRKLLTSGMSQRLIAQKMKRSIGAIQSRIFLFKKPRKRLPPKRS
jgi:hypothetical protein